MAYILNRRLRKSRQLASKQDRCHLVWEFMVNGLHLGFAALHYKIHAGGWLLCMIHGHEALIA